MRNVVLIGGPTGSGKSAVAMALARKLDSYGGAVIINSDAMQVYKDLRILSSRPSLEDELICPHRLYGFLSAVDICSAAIWKKYAEAAILYAWNIGAVPIVVGGTGLYFKVLENGLAEIPSVNKIFKQEASQILDKDGLAGLYADLKRIDPISASNLSPTDTQRIIRAWEVQRSTGRSIKYWQARNQSQPLKARWHGYRLLPDRSLLYQRIEARFIEMVKQGVLGEVDAFLDKNIDSRSPCARAIGLRELSSCLSKKITLEDAISAGQQASRHLAKRQYTWFRNQMTHWVLFEQDIETIVNGIFTNLCEFVLTPEI